MGPRPWAPGPSPPWWTALELDLPQCLVEDTRLALGHLASAWRDRFTGRVAAVTGSNGKTTVKEMLAAILAQVGPTRATQGNLNNDIGMPLTLLSRPGRSPSWSWRWGPTTRARSPT
jgi:UDP-N-acetylmuramyl pentapeptide synthase